MKQFTNISELFESKKINCKYLKVCAPMVRYSKIQFRTLVREFGVDLCFTPMIMADSFCQNSKARTNEFSTTIKDSPLVVQFAANNVNDFSDASKLISPYAEGVDLNCGCPQSWAMKQGYGCALLSQPELIHSLVREIKNYMPSTFSISVKIRILNDLKKTIDMCQKLEKCGVTFLTVHGRTPSQKSGDEINRDALKEVCASLSIPVIANGGVKSLADADYLYSATNCNGVMAASGILSNPALFNGSSATPSECIKLWMLLKDKDSNKITFQCYHHHLVFMLDKILTKKQKKEFNYLSTFESVDEYLINNLLDTNSCDQQYSHIEEEYIECKYEDDIILKHSKKCRCCLKSIHYCVCNKYDSNAVNGSYFTSHVKDNDDIYSGLFDEP